VQRLLDLPVLRLLALALGLLGALAAVHVYLSPALDLTTPGLTVPRADGRHVLFFLVDGLRPEDADDPRLTFLAPYREHGFVADIEPCMDRLTVPCASEMFVGVASGGLLGAAQNLTRTGNSLSNNLFADLRARGLKVGAAHHGELGAFSSWFDEEYRARAGQEEAVLGMMSRGLDLVVYHHTGLDEVAHKTRVTSKKYAAGLAELDALGRRLLDALPADWELVVAGDHGHTTNGRHLTGLDVPTRFMASADVFQPKAFAERLPIATYRYLLGARFGVLPPPAYAGTDLAELLPSGTVIRASAEGRAYEGEPHPGPWPWWAALPSLALAGLAVGWLGGGATAWKAAALVAGGGLGAGLGYPALVAWAHQNTGLARWDYLLALATFGAAAVATRRGRGEAAWYAVLAAYAVLAPGTVYSYGLYRNVITLAVLLLLPSFLRAWRRPDADRVRLASLLLLSLGALQLADSAHVRQFAIQRFPKLDRTPGFVLALAWGAVSLRVLPGRAGWLAAVATGLGASGLYLFEGWELLPLTLLTGACMLGAPAALPLVVGQVAVSWYGAAAAGGLACDTLVMLCLTEFARGGAPAWVVPGAAVALSYHSLSFTTRLRTSGLDFAFAQPWFPGDWHERLWWLVGVAAAIKILVGPFLVIGAARLDAAGRERAGMLALLRALTLPFFVGGFLLAAGNPPRWRLMELVDEHVGWFVLVAVFTGWGWRRTRTRAAT
jgi:hypothetical protein